jgi:FkbM family methyltransferase
MKKIIYMFRDMAWLLEIMNFREMLHVFYQLKIIKKNIIKYKYLNDELYINNDGPVIYHMVFSTKKIKNLVDGISLEDVNTCFDVGANSGIFSYFLKKRYNNAEIHCFEPSPELIKCIELNLNRFNNIHIKNQAICDVSGSVNFYVNKASQQTNSLIIDSVTPFCEEGSMDMISVDSNTLDRYCIQNNIDSIDVLKVDIQGAEKSLLRGAKDILNNVNLSIFEISFLDADIFETSEILLNNFNKYKVINDVKMGADIIFYKDKPNRKE